MKHFLVLFTFSLSVFLGGCMTLSESDRNARAAAVDYLDLLDAGKYKQAYAMRPPRVKVGESAEEFAHLMMARRAPLGKPKSREMIRASWSRTLSGAPDGLYQFIIFKTVFEHKATTYEGLTLTAETGQWQVSGYHCW